MFVDTCFSSMESCESGLIDNGYTNRMTYNKELFTQLGEASSSKVRMGDDKHIAVKSKGTISISTCSGTTFISNVLFVPEIDQNMFKCWSIN